MSKFVEYLKETKVELSHVAWPTKKQTVLFTLLVIGLSFGVAVYLGVLDFGLTALLKTFIFN